MKIVKDVTSCFEDNSGNKESVPSFQGGFEIWFYNLYDDAHNKSGLASDFTEIQANVDTFDEAVKAALSFSDAIYEEYQVVIRQVFSIWNEDIEGYESVSVDLLAVDFSEGQQKLALQDAVLTLYEEQFDKDESYEDN